MLCIGMSALIASSGFARGQNPNEMLPPKTAGHALSIDQLRYCEFQSVRLESANSAMDRHPERVNNNVIDAFNRAVDDWNARCGSGRYRVRDQKRIENELRTQRQRLAAEGGNLQYWIQKRDANAFYVVASSLNLRAAPTPEARVVKRLDQFATVYASGGEVNGWLPVTVGQRNGYVALRFVRKGNGGPARRAHCKSIAGQPVTHAWQRDWQAYFRSREWTECRCDREVEKPEQQDRDFLLRRSSQDVAAGGHPGRQLLVDVRDRE